MKRRGWIIGGIGVWALALPALPTASAQEPEPGKGLEITLETTIEEGKKVLMATVTREGTPVEGAYVAFYVRRTFGLLRIGGEETLDDGTAVTPFPERLPGGLKSELQVVIEAGVVRGQPTARIERTIPGGATVPAEPDPFPRALWSPRAPLGLILTIVVLLSGVWLTYVYVWVQLSKIAKGAKR